MGRTTEDRPQPGSMGSSRRILLLPCELRIINRDLTTKSSKTDCLGHREQKARSMQALTPLAAATQDSPSMQRPCSLPRGLRARCLGSSSILEQLGSSHRLRRRYLRLNSKNQHRRGEQQHDQIHMTNQLVTYNQSDPTS